MSHRWFHIVDYQLEHDAPFLFGLDEQLEHDISVLLGLNSQFKHDTSLPIGLEDQPEGDMSVNLSLKDQLEGEASLLHKTEHWSLLDTACPPFRLTRQAEKRLLKLGFGSMITRTIVQWLESRTWPNLLPFMTCSWDGIYTGDTATARR